jgi:hypothetical protein
MTANKLKVAGAAAAVLIIGAAALTIGQQGGTGSAAPGLAAGTHDAAPTTPGAGAAPAAVRAQPAKPSVRKPGDKPLWRSLTPAQQLALQPLQGEWDAMDGVRKQKWLQLSNRFGAMQPEEQQRVHERMREWVKLTPEQRELARETYTRTRKIGPDQKTASWESYQLLPDDQKKKLAASGNGRKPANVVPAQANANPGKSVAPLNQGSAACPAGLVKNAVSATPPCVPPAATAPATPQAPPPATAPSQPPAPPEKQVPANWGITPNNA